jgi:hypothetical protein
MVVPMKLAATTCRMEFRSEVVSLELIAQTSLLALQELISTGKSG